MLKKIHSFLNRLNLPNWLVILLFATLLLRIPSFFEPYYYGDEMIYLTLGQGIRQGIPLYAGLYDNKPPLLYLIAALAGNLVWFKIFLALAATVSVTFFAKIVKNQKIPTLIFALLVTLPLLEGNIANAENFLMAFSLPAIYLLLKPNFKIKSYLLAGFLFGLAFLTKVPALFDLPVVFVFFLLTQKFSLKKFLWTLLGFTLPLAFCFAWFSLKGSLPDFVKAAFLQNFGYLSSWRPSDVQKSFFARNLPLLFRGLVVISGLGLVFIFRKKLSAPFLLGSVWLLFALFAATLSERPYPHYLLQSAAPVALFLGILLTSKRLEQSLVIIPLSLAFLVPVIYRYWYYPSFSYYRRFLSFVFGKITKEVYLSKFSSSVNTNYQLADFLATSSHTSDRVFVWGPDSPALYALSRRLPPLKYTADYHIEDYADKKVILKELAALKPKFILFQANAKMFPGLTPFLRTNYLLINQVDGTEVWSLRSLK